MLVDEAREITEDHVGPSKPLQDLAFYAELESRRN